MTTSPEEIIDILPLYDLQQRSKEEQIRHIEMYRNTFTNKEITDFWGKKPPYIYTLMNKLGMKRAEYKTRQAPVQKRTKGSTKVAEAKVEVDVVEVPQVVVQQVETKPELDGFAVNINGVYTSEMLIKRLEKISLILLDEETEFEIKLSIKETK